MCDSHSFKEKQFQTDRNFFIIWFFLCEQELHRSMILIQSQKIFKSFGWKLTKDQFEPYGFPDI